MNLRHALLKVSINTMSSSFSVYQGPPVNAIDGSRPSSIYILRVGCWHTFDEMLQGSRQIPNLDRWNALDKLFLDESFNASIDNGLVQVGLCFKVFRPYSCASKSQRQI